MTRPELPLPTLTPARVARLHRALEETREILRGHVDGTIAELHRALVVAETEDQTGGERLAGLACDGGRSSPLTPGTIVGVTAGYYELTVGMVLGTGRSRAVVRARQVAMYLARELTDASYPEIGRALDRDHTTVMHAVSAVGGRIRTDPPTRRHVEYLTGLLRGAASTRQTG